MSGLFEGILTAHNGDKIAASIEVASDLMRGDSATFKAGYDARSAAYAVRDLYGLSASECVDVLEAIS